MDAYTEGLEAILDGISLIENLANGKPGTYWADAEECFRAAEWSFLYDQEQSEQMDSLHSWPHLFPPE